MRTLLAAAVIISLSACGSVDSDSDGRDRRGRQPLVFLPDELPTVAVGEEFSFEIAVTGNTTPVGSMGLVEGELPDSVTFTWHDQLEIGVLTGALSEPVDVSFTIGASCYGTQSHGQTGNHIYHLVAE